MNKVKITRKQKLAMYIQKYGLKRMFKIDNKHITIRIMKEWQMRYINMKRTITSLELDCILITQINISKKLSLRRCTH